WAELVYPSIGIWTASIQDPELLAAGSRAINDWAIEYQRFSLRYVCTATIPLLAVDHAVAEIERTADLGFTDWNTELWEPVWQALEHHTLVCCYHIGTEPHDAAGAHGAYFRGPGGA